MWSLAGNAFSRPMWLRAVIEPTVPLGEIYLAWSAVAGGPTFSSAPNSLETKLPVARRTGRHDFERASHRVDVTHHNLVFRPNHTYSVSHKGDLVVLTCRASQCGQLLPLHNCAKWKPNSDGCTLHAVRQLSTPGDRTCRFAFPRRATTMKLNLEGAYLQMTAACCKTLSRH